MKSIVLVASAWLVAVGIAWAEPSDQPDTFMREPAKETVYATDDHMAFSVRSSLIFWLGGVTVVEEHAMRLSEREGWWGDDVPLIEADVVGAPTQ